MTATTTEFAPAPTEHDWLRDNRVAATRRFLEQGIPSSQEEDWRHSRIADLDLDRFESAASPSPESPAEASKNRPIVGAIGEFAALAVLYDGYLVHQEGTAPGLTLVDLATESSARDGILGQPGPDPFADLNTSQAPSPLLVEAAPGAVIEHPVVVTHWAGIDRSASFPRTIIRAGEGSQLTVVELWMSDEVEALVVPRTEIYAEAGAIARHVVISDLGPRVWQLASTTTHSGRNASVTSSTVALGGEYARFRINAELLDEGGEAQLVAAYFGDGNQVHDFRTLQAHTGKRTSSDLTFKGAVTGSARSVYTGLIRVNPGASATSAFLTNRNLVLSESARAYSVPNLEIVNENDLRSCGHAATSGPIDEDQIFYLESRGVPTDIARRLIILGFFEDVLSRVPVPGLSKVVRDRVAAKLTAMSEVS